MPADSAYKDGSYHREVFSNDPWIQQVLATRRAAKLAQWITPQDAVFEFGVGTALNLRELKASRQVGFDVNSSSAELCKQFGIEFVSNIETVTETFDVVLAHHVLEHVEEPLNTLRQLRRLLKANGRLLVFVPLERGSAFVRGEPNMHLFAWTPQTLGNLVERAGYRVERYRIAGYGYEQRLAPLARWGKAPYGAALWLARLIKPCDEIQLEANVL